MSGVFVTGTDTGVGKTVVACALARGLREGGIDIGVMKPIETGVTAAGPEDARALLEASGCTDALGDVCPQRFRLPAAPNVAAEAEQRRLDIDALIDSYQKLRSRHEAMLVEGAGGLLVPITRDATMVDFANRLGLPLVIVARGALGTINHTRLSLEVAAARGADVIGVVISHSSGVLSAADEANLAHLREWLGGRLIGEIPPMNDGELPSPDQAGLEAVRRRWAALDTNAPAAAR